MSEANTPKPEPSSPDGNDSSFLDEPIDELIASLEESPPSSQNTESEVEGKASWLQKEPTLAKPETQSEQFTDQLYEQNHQLLYRNAQLQKALETAQNQLDQQQLRLRQAEDLNVQQNDELNAAYDQNLSLSQDLKSSRQKVQHQEEKIVHLSEQLQVSQQRVAQLERECALIQKQFQEQSYKLSQAEKQLRELSYRLQQQRRHTWQFKSALNKCLETNAQKQEVEVTPVTAMPSQPIAAWSSQHKEIPSSSTEINALTEEDIDATDDAETATPEAAVNFVEESLEIIDDFEIALPQFEDNLSSYPDLNSAKSSPAPMVTPYHNRKKRKSYAAVELPNFTR